jgi:YfiH family protein
MFERSSIFSQSIRHGFFTRKGGVSKGYFDSLNANFNADSREDILTNRAIIAEKMGLTLEALSTFDQCHTNNVLTLTSPISSMHIKADGMVTNQPGILLGVLTGDCCPILFVDETTKVIGACHAGWKGAHAGIIQNTIAAMLKLGARIENINAAIGPAISQESYEVGAEFYDDFIKLSATNKRFFKPFGAKFIFDLKGFCQSILINSGVQTIEILPFNTYTDKDLFFSFRRKTHNNEPTFGNQISVIRL